MSSSHHHVHPGAGSTLLASGSSALLSFPLWRASAIAQSGVAVGDVNVGIFRHIARYSKPWAEQLAFYSHAFKPPYRGALAVLTGMTWARGAIFYGSDVGRDWLENIGAPDLICTAGPPLVLSAFVQVVNQPIVRGSIALQLPGCKQTSVIGVLRDISQRKGFMWMWHGTNAGILKAVPKYCTAVMVKDWMDDFMAPLDPKTSTRQDYLVRSAKKSLAAGIAGATITNPFDVIRNEMFQTDKTLMETLRSLNKNEGMKWLWRGVDKNLVSVAFPIAMTIFLADYFSRIQREGWRSVLGSE